MVYVYGNGNDCGFCMFDTIIRQKEANPMDKQKSFGQEQMIFLRN